MQFRFAPAVTGGEDDQCQSNSLAVGRALASDLIRPGIADGAHVELKSGTTPQSQPQGDAEGSLLYTAAALKTQTVRDLGKLADKLGVPGWRSMRKDELVRSLVRVAKQKAAKRNGTKRSSAANSAKTKEKASRSEAVAKSKPAAARQKSAKSAKPKNPRATRRIQRVNEERARRKNLAGTSTFSAKRPAATGNGNGNGKAVGQALSEARDGKRDRIILLVRDAYWLQAVWELSRASVDRARAAMAEHWHTSKPVIRLVELDDGSSAHAERVVREIVIHGGVRTWYIDVQNSPRSFRVDIGYLAANGKFHSLARSNSVSTPRPGNGDDLEQDWSDIAENCEKIYALSGGYSEDAATRELQELFEERLGRPMGAPAGSRFGVGADKMLMQQRSFEFEVDAEMIVFGLQTECSHHFSRHTCQAAGRWYVFGPPQPAGPPPSTPGCCQQPRWRRAADGRARSGTQYEGDGTQDSRGESVTGRWPPDDEPPAAQENWGSSETK